MYKAILLCWIGLMPLSIFSQSDDDAFFIKEIHNQVLSYGECYDWLHGLTKGIGHRLSGSEAYDQAVSYTSDIMSSFSLDRVYTQRCEVNYWIRGNTEVMLSYGGAMDIPLQAISLGGSLGGNGNPITGEIIEVKTLQEVDDLGRENIEGKVVFYNRPMDPTQIRTFNAYGGAVDQRVYGASKASEYGGVGALIRSMTAGIDRVPHTGSSYYAEGITPVPGVGISTYDAEKLSTLLSDQKVEATIISDNREGGLRASYNVIGELKGSEFPDQIILVGGHLDSWDVGEGAHDDGTGCVQSMQVLKTLQDLGYQPKRTIRCVLFANEENGLAGAREYARLSDEAGEFHLAALESDAGGFVPRGFAMDGHKDVLEAYAKCINDWLPLLEPYGLTVSTGGSGADISPLKNQKGLLIGLRPDSQRYFDVHHTEADVFEAVHKRELELGAAAMTSLIYLIDKYGLPGHEK